MFEKEVIAVEDLTSKQNNWRQHCINLIASENVMSNRARRLLNSDFTHRYAEGHPGKRYYEGTKFIDIIETNVKEHLRQLFNCKQTEVRTISGTNANDAVFNSIVPRNALCYVSSIPQGGHISHQRIGALGKYTKNIKHLPVTKDGFHIDIEKTKDVINSESPALIVFSKSMILFPEPVKELANICREKGTRILYDGAHVLGLIAGGCFQKPLEDGAEFITASTHKTFFGPQRGIILSNLADKEWHKIDKSAFPGSTSNHHLNTLPPLLISTLEMREFGNIYANDVITNAKHLASSLHKLGFKVQCADFGYTESHQVVVDVRDYGGGGTVAKVLCENDIITNSNLLPFDGTENLSNPSGIRLGVQEMTRLGMKKNEMEEIARMIKETVIDKKTVKDAVNHFREKFQTVHYSFDNYSEGKTTKDNVNHLKFAPLR